MCIITPLKYKISHIIIGFCAYNYNILWAAILLYQFIQYWYNIRFYIFDYKILPNNTLNHTINKLYDYVIGYLIAYIYYK